MTGRPRSRRRWISRRSYSIVTTAFARAEKGGRKGDILNSRRGRKGDILNSRRGLDNLGKASFSKLCVFPH